MHLTTTLSFALPQATYGTYTPKTYTTSTTSTTPSTYYWTVTNWHVDCARSGCTYNFNVTGPISAPNPSFLAYCYGSDTGYYAQCKVLQYTATASGAPSVAASLRPNTGDQIAVVSVSLAFVESDTGVARNITGYQNAQYNGFVAPLQSFTIVPSGNVGVA
ncbi:uncharacterized protein MYCFIDRAFT_212642 [Pseudocercospora fijiensis CIRAD86]|uniref:Uncharacterized protein n=1 Tax=Pseudocercospora fijiensis (strain CIRAD86) TaxID=383855 RepID=M2ZG60_PSEFD|nr:uncharacterized protein MYCFIDRAFT_212642 [Pseudocercospora fijiensis CIRAD86]EME78129.1 hypothetical protein MYCFIDRAFT_212642 [Pseudocercospora fijiensis CIRAD86]